jgi:hypothetical protein
MFLAFPPDSAGHNCCVVAVDLCSKCVSLTAAVSSKDPRDANNPLTAAKTATIFFNKIVSHKGFPLAIVSDRDSSFTSDFWRKLHQLACTKLFMSTAYHPQTDGLTERNNRHSLKSSVHN